jgi:hypothetical protein
MQAAVNNPRRVFGLGSLNVLSDQLLLDVFSHLSAADLVHSASLTSHAFYVLSNEEILWRHLCCNKYPGNFQFKGSWKETYITPHGTLAALAQQSKPKLYIEGNYEICACNRSSLVSCAGFVSEYLQWQWYLSHVLLYPFSADYGRVDRRTQDSLTVEDYYYEYEAQNKPVLITGLTNQWKAMQVWSNSDTLLAKYGQVVFKISHKGNQKIRMNLADYMLYAKSQHDSVPFYVFDSNFGEKAPGMLEEYEVPKYFKQDYFAVFGEKRPEYRWFVMGPARSGVLHLLIVSCSLF